MCLHYLRLRKRNVARAQVRSPLVDKVCVDIALQKEPPSTQPGNLSHSCGTESSWTKDTEITQLTEAM